MTMAKIDWSKHNARTDVHLQSQADRDTAAYLKDVERSKFRFGKHKGKLIKDIPSSYLRWIVDTWQGNRPFMKAMINNARYELSQRQKIASSQKRTKVENPKRSVQDAKKTD